MANEYKLSYTAAEIDERLGRIDNIVKTVNGVAPDKSGNVEVDVPEGGGGGADGYSPTAKVTQTATGATITITDKTGTTTATITNGKDGKDGVPGTDGKNGTTPAFSIGTVTTLAAGSNATASITGTTEKPVLNLGIPQGQHGEGGGSGGGSAEWGLIGEVTSDGSGDATGIYLPVTFSEYKELYIEAVDLASDSLTFRLVIGSALAWYNGHVLWSVKRNESIMYSTHILIIDGAMKILSGYNSGYAGASGIMITNSPRNDFLASDFKYVRLDANNTTVPEGVTLKIWGCK